MFCNGIRNMQEIDVTKGNIMNREKVRTVADVLREVLEQEGLNEGLHRLKVIEAFDSVVGKSAAENTYRKYFRDGVLYCNVSSAAIRSQLFMNRSRIIEDINGKLGSDEVRMMILK